MNKADIFVYPLKERHYGTGEQVILEAMASGLPIICFSNPAESAIITHNNNGLLVSSTTGFIEEVLTLSSDISLMQKLGTNAHNDIKNRFSIEKVAIQFMALFQSIISSENSFSGGKFTNLCETDLPYASMLANSFLDNKPYLDYANGLVENSIYYAVLKYRSILSSDRSSSNASKATPFQYRKYFPNSPLISRLCKILESQDI